MQLRRIQQDQQRRALISRDQLKSDQACLAACSEIIEENEAESDRTQKTAKKPQNREEIIIDHKHVILQEEEIVTTL